MAVTAKNVSMAQNNNGGYSAKPMNKRPKPISLPPLGYDEFNPTQGHGFSSPQYIFYFSRTVLFWRNNFTSTILTS